MFVFVVLATVLASSCAALLNAGPPDQKLTSISIGSSSFAQQSLPLSYVESWPVWMASPSGDSVSLLPNTGDEGDWVNPTAFEQLWLPQDLPRPAARAALGVVVKDGVPRYIFPCTETTVMAGNSLWHNRGLNSLPLAKTWLAFGDVPVDDLRLSCYQRPLAADEAADEESNDSSAAQQESAADDVGGAEWTPVLPLTAVGEAIDAVFRVLGDAPDELGSGFSFLIAPLSASPLPPDALASGQQLRLFLSDVDATPTSLDPEDRTSWLWNRGECDLAIYDVAAGGESVHLPDAYRPLFDGAVPGGK